MAKTISAAETARLRGLVDRVASALDCGPDAAIEALERAASALEAGQASPQRWAAQILRLRAARSDLVPAPVFGEPAWDMLLDLLVNEADGRRVSVSSLTIASRVAHTTALRHIERLIEHGLLVRVDDASDGRRSWVALTPAARDGLLALIERFRAGVA